MAAGEERMGREGGEEGEDKLKSAFGQNNFCHDRMDVIATNDHSAGRK